MKSKFLSTLIVTIMLCGIFFILAGCGQEVSNNSNENLASDNQTTESKEVQKPSKDEENPDDIYFKVLKNETSYVDESNVEAYFKEYAEAYNFNQSVKYSLFDLDGDGQNEMIILVSGEMYLILNREGNIVYGFTDVLRGMLRIKTDGTYSGSGGAAISVICKSTFEKNKRNIQTLAECDTTYNKYIINEKSVSRAEFEKYFEEFNNKPNVEFKDYNNNEESTNDEQKQTNSNGNSYNKSSAFREGVYNKSLAGTDAEGYEESLTFSDGNVSYNETYWGRKRSGTYDVQGNTITVKYTSGIDADSINGNTPVSNLNEVEVYKIEDNKLIMQSTSTDPYYKAESVVYELKNN
ncbi:MAG: hypothetical protein J6J36_03925 [Clostridia bacterium]|nr:hypothetical protein [Clostridia bacterium]